MALTSCKACGAEGSSDSLFCSRCGKPAPRVNTGCGVAIGLALLVLIGLGVLIAVVDSLSKGTQRAKTPNVELRTPREIAMSKVKLKYTLSKDSSIMFANFTVQNENEYAVKDLEITCEHFAPSKTRIDSNTRTIYEIVKPHSSRRFRQFNMGFIHPQAASSNCQVKNLTIVE